jgi:hypothetical protein
MNIRITLPSLLLGFSALANSTSATAAGPPAETVTTNNEVRHWFAFRPARDDFQETILDCSRWVEAPTGRHGFVTAKGDRFVFEGLKGRDVTLDALSAGTDAVRGFNLGP